MATRDRESIAGSCDIDPERLLKVAVANYEDVILDLHEMRASLRASESYSETEFRRVVTMVSRSVQTVYDERKRLDDFWKRQAGAGDDGSFDMEAARAEIGRRLDRIRSAQDPGDLPG